MTRIRLKYLTLAQRLEYTPTIGSIYRWYMSGNLVEVIGIDKDQVTVQTYGFHIYGHIKPPIRKVVRTHTLVRGKLRASGGTMYYLPVQPYVEMT